MSPLELAACLTREESLDFIAHKLHLPLTHQEVATPSLPVLQKICAAYLEHHLYSTLRLLSLPVDQRRIPSYEEIKEIGLQQLGGICYENNVFLSMLVTALGFQLDFLATKAYVFKHNNHSAMVVHLDGANYLVDSAIYPPVMFNLINLDFEGDVSPVYQQAMYEVKVERKVIEGAPGFESKYRLTPDTDITTNLKMTVDEDGWASVMQFNLNYVQLADLVAANNITRTDAKMSPILSRIFFVRYPKKRLLQFAVTALVYVAETGVREVVQARSREEMIELLTTHFGDYHPASVIQGAVDHYLQLDASPPGFVPIAT